MTHTASDASEEGTFRPIHGCHTPREGDRGVHGAAANQAACGPSTHRHQGDRQTIELVVPHDRIVSPTEVHVKVHEAQERGQSKLRHWTCPEGHADVWIWSEVRGHRA